jgi:hypothetical protein
MICQKDLLCGTVQQPVSTIGSYESPFLLVMPATGISFPAISDLLLEIGSGANL